MSSRIDRSLYRTGPTGLMGLTRPALSLILLLASFSAIALAKAPPPNAAQLQKTTVAQNSHGTSAHAPAPAAQAGQQAEHQPSHTELSADAHSDGADAPQHGGGEATEAEVPELPSFITVLLHTKVGNTEIRHTHAGHFLHVYEKQIIMVLLTLLLSLGIFGTLRLRAQIPGRMQALLEMVVEGFYTFLGGILGKHARTYTPFLGTLFVFIFVNNIAGIIPLFGAATSKFQTTATLALIVFVYVHYNGIRESGIVAWVDHLMGSPRDLVGWLMVPLLFPLHVIGELARPLSLSLRLFGNIRGEEILIGVFMLLGISLMGSAWPRPIIGVPLHLPFFFLALITSTIQALVFTLLTTIYLMLVLPSEEHH